MIESSSHVTVMYQLQIDLEMSFVKEDGIITLVEEIVADIFTKNLPTHPQPFLPFPRLTYSQAMQKVL